MKRNSLLCKYLFIGLFVTVLTACSGDGDSPSGTPAGDGSSPAAATVLNGVVADGYLTGATVFLDRNQNRLYDNGEPMALSAAGGAFTLDVEAGEGERYPIAVQVVAGQTIDEDNGLPVEKTYLLEAPKGHWKFVSPLTTLVKTEQDKNPSFTELQATLSVRSKLGIDDNVSLYEDYLAYGNGGKAQNVRWAEEYRRTHKVAQVVASMLGKLREDVTRNLGGRLNDTEQHAVAYLISDKIMGQGLLIKQALDAERNAVQPIDLAALKDSVEAAVDPATLDADLLARYERRNDQNMPTWDMQPPGLQRTVPLDGDSASIDVTVEMFFDEPLDETLISDNLIYFRGPNGRILGTVSYDNEQKRLSFEPDQVLLPFTTYQVTLKKELADTLGNPLSEDVDWSFTTVFDKTPPALPDF